MLTAVLATKYSRVVRIQDRTMHTARSIHTPSTDTVIILVVLL